MLKLDVPALSCGHCVKTVTRAIQTIDPNAAVDVDLAAKRVDVRSTAGEATLRAALAEAGYPAT